MLEVVEILLQHRKLLSWLCLKESFDWMAWKEFAATCFT